MPELNQINKNKIQIWLPLLLSVMIVLGMIIGYKMSGGSVESLIEKEGKGQNFTTGRVEEIIRYIELKYVDEINSEVLIEEAVKSILLKLDPHSIYLSPELVKTANEEMEGSFTGLGIESMMIDDTLNIYNVLSESPAYKGGIKKGDKVIQIGDSIVAGKNLEFDQIKSLMQKEDGEIVSMKIISLGSNEMVDKNVEIGSVPLYTSNIGYMMDEKTGYILIKRFTSNTYKEFMLLLEELVENEGLENLIIDVRQNPGGYLPQTTDILSQLFPQKGNLLVYTEGKNGRLTEYKSTGKSFFFINKIAVLVDGGSASGSEILAGAIQDWDRGIIVGRRTYGKGLVQEQYNLKNGAALRLTIARYHTPSGRIIQKPYEDMENYNIDYSNRIKSGELVYAEKMTVNDSTKYFTLKDRRVVYGGGGIIPDVFVPIDPNILDANFLQFKSYIQEFIYLLYRDGYFAKEKDFVLTKEKENKIYNDYESFVLSKKPELVNSPLSEWKEDIMLRLRAGIARQLYGELAMIKILNETDDDVIRAMKELKIKK